MEEIIALLKSPGWWFSTVVVGVAMGLLTNYLSSGRMIAHLQSGKAGLAQLDVLRWVQIAVGIHILLLSLVVLERLVSRAEFSFGFFSAAVLIISIPLLQIYWLRNPVPAIFLFPILFVCFVWVYLSAPQGAEGFERVQASYLFGSLFAFIFTWLFSKELLRKDGGSGEKS
ncbi:MAG: hypothetical protein KF835_04970 [Xanthobacteraceae bacterium]|nr:hypothetical protein [Xanthobacteraceae bacterium]